MSFSVDSEILSCGFPVAVLCSIWCHVKFPNLKTCVLFRVMIKKDTRADENCVLLCIMNDVLLFSAIWSSGHPYLRK